MCVCVYGERTIQLPRRNCHVVNTRAYRPGGRRSIATRTPGKTARESRDRPGFAGTRVPVQSRRETLRGDQIIDGYWHTGIIDSKWRPRSPGVVIDAEPPPVHAYSDDGTDAVITCPRQIDRSVVTTINRSLSSRPRTASCPSVAVLPRGFYSISVAVRNGSRRVSTAVEYHKRTR